jgi:hypothetical protein
MDFSFLASSNLRLLLIGGAGVAVLLWAWRRWQRGRDSATAMSRPRTLDAVDTLIGWPPEATRVLTSKHQRALDLLRQALPQHVVLAQVPISHFIKVPTRYSYLEWQRRIGHVCVDLMVCDAASNVIAVIELRQPDRVLSERARKRHGRLERVLSAAGIPVHLWNESLLPDPAAVRKAFTSESALPPMEAQMDQGPDTSPLTPTRFGPGRARGPAPSDMDAHEHLRQQKDPPRSTWFDELNATRPTQLDSVEVIAHDANHPAVKGFMNPPPVARAER